MSWDKKDKALIAASALVGYCMSAEFLLTVENAQTEKWVKGLAEKANIVGNRMADIWAEPITLKVEGE